MRKLRCKKLGNLSKGTYLARDSAQFQPSVLTPEFIPFNATPELQNLLSLRKTDGISYKNK